MRHTDVAPTTHPDPRTTATTPPGWEDDTAYARRGVLRQISRTQGGFLAGIALTADGATWVVVLDDDPRHPQPRHPRPAAHGTCATLAQAVRLAEAALIEACQRLF